jgi:hypothetical protein
MSSVFYLPESSQCSPSTLRGLSASWVEGRAVRVDVSALVVVAGDDGQLCEERFPDELREGVAAPGDAFDETNRCTCSLVKVSGHVDLSDLRSITGA